MSRLLNRLLAHIRNNIAVWVSMPVVFVLTWLITGTPCVLHSTTGLPCPGCGLTRALMLALRGDFTGAWNMHPLFWLAPLLIGAILVLLAVAPRQLTEPAWRVVWIAAIILFVAVYGVRMTQLFPMHEPLTFNHSAIIPRLIQAVLWVFTQLSPK